MACLHTTITPNIDIIDLVCFTYPSDVTDHILTRDVLESVDAYIPSLGFLWLVRAWENAWDVGAFN